MLNYPIGYYVSTLTCTFSCEQARASSEGTNPAIPPPFILAVDFGPSNEEINVRY